MQRAASGGVASPPHLPWQEWDGIPGACCCPSQNSYLTEGIHNRKNLWMPPKEQKLRDSKAVSRSVCPPQAPHGSPRRAHPLTPHLLLFQTRQEPPGSRERCASLSSHPACKSQRTRGEGRSEDRSLILPTLRPDQVWGKEEVSTNRKEVEVPL